MSRPERTRSGDGALGASVVATGASAAASGAKTGGVGTPNSAVPTAAATRTRNSRIREALPPLGCTRLVRRIMYVRVAGSIQIDVPVNPVWPTEPIGKNGAWIRE